MSVLKSQGFNKLQVQCVDWYLQILIPRTALIETTQLIPLPIKNVEKIINIKPYTSLHPN
jgi:hypothetical protein